MAKNLHQDLDAIKSARKHKDPPPRFHYEDRSFTIVEWVVFKLSALLVIWGHTCSLIVFIRLQTPVVLSLTFLYWVRLKNFLWLSSTVGLVTCSWFSCVTCFFSSFPDLSDSEVEITIVRGLNIPVPSGKLIQVKKT